MKAIAVFQGRVKGTVHFEDYRDSVILNIQLSGLKRNALHGFHIHEAGDLTDECESMCAHFNPYHTEHGAPGMKIRHVGDLGNILTDSNGHCTMIIKDNMIKLKGKCNVIGRGLVIHADPDDYGLDGHDDSKKTGHSGKRIACAIIGISKDNF
jgi:Cu-Zn family superoxide dismutase